MNDFPTYKASISFIYTPEYYLQVCLDEEQEPDLDEWERIVREYAWEDLQSGYYSLEEINE